MAAEEKLENLGILIEDALQRLEKKIKEKEATRISTLEKKNSHLHMVIETSLMRKVEREAKEGGVSIAEFVRNRLRGSSQLDRIEDKLNRLQKDKI